MEDVRSAAEFRRRVSGVAPCVVHFWAPWCEACTHMDVVLAQLRAENPHAEFLRVEAEEQPEISEQYGVATVPLFLFFKGSEVVDRVEGANAPELAHKVALHLSDAAAHPKGSSSGVGATASTSQVINSLQHTLANSAPPSTSGVPMAGGAVGTQQDRGELTAELRQRLQALVVAQPVMLFMKGSPAEPKCGFSSKVVAALNEIGSPYGHFDILADNSVRQGMKVFSDWPTFPQLYAGGEFVGGCDIVLEMHRSGELRRVVEKAAGSGTESANTLQERLTSLVQSSPVMLFMKGTPEAPQCGFSRRVVQALQEAGVSFATFDILQDEAVRQGLKDFSQWPTYPQLYCKGQFIGGCDIVTELKKNGELASALAL